MNTRSFASLNIACETLKMEIENEWGRSRGALCYMLTGTTVFVTLKNGNKVYKYESLLVRCSGLKSGFIFWKIFSV